MTRLARFVWAITVCATALDLPCSAQKLAWSWSNPQPHGNDIVGMAWNGTLGVQVCELGQVYTSPNLIDWFSQNSNLTNNLQAATFFGNRIIIVGANGAIAYSDDGVNFTNCSVNSEGDWLVSVAASSNLVVAVGDNGVLFTSSDGATWTFQSGQPSGNNYFSWLTSVTHGNGVFVTTGDQGETANYGTPYSYIATSSDGIHWVPQVTGNLSLLKSLGNLESVTWVNTSGSITNFPYTGFWAVDDAGHAIYSTNNGASWNQFKMFNSTNVLYTVAADDTTALLAGDSEVRLGFYLASSNRVVWPEQTGQALTTVPAWTYFAAVSQTDGVYELAGYDGQLVQSYINTNGNYNWSTPYSSSRDWLWQVMVTNGLYVAVGDNARIMTSANGVDWTVEAFLFTNSVSLSNTVFFCVGGASNLLVTAGTGGSLAISPNFAYPVVQTNTDGSLFTNIVSSLGVSWYSMFAPAGTTNDLAGVGTFSNKFYLVGGNGTILALNFTNWSSLNANNLNALLGGTNWAKQTSGTTNYLSGITTFTNGLLVLTGDNGTILTSPDGTNWTSRTSGTTNWLYRVHCANGRLLAVGENGVALTSTNGTNWASVKSGVTNWLNDAIMVSNSCYVVGNQGTVLASTNLVNWTNIGTITARSLYGAATQNGQLVVAGFEGTILRSQIIPASSPVNFVNFAQSGGYNLIFVAGVVDQQFTLDASTDLVNWVTGPLVDLIYGDGTLVFYQSLPTNPPSAQFYRCTLVP
jgi:hypothetical protein